MAELTGFDSLTVFQSAPLVWIDENQGKHTLESPNFVAEAKDILESVREGASRIDAEIDVIFEPANIERLSAFLGDTNQSPVMHFSGHGHPEFLGLEHEGALQPLKTEELRELVATGTGDLKVVFVAACYSQMAGEAFVKAGVKHVVCCQQNEELRDSAAIVFARHFYRALANGNKLERSFEHARQVVRVSPDIIDSSREMEKFILLPENQDHDVDVFYTSPKQRVTHTLMPRNLPPAPRILLCRELYVFCLIEKLKFASLVSVTGPIGIGRSSVAKATCNYLFERSRTFDTFYWVSTDHCYSNNCVSQKLQQAYQDIREEQLNDISNYRIVEIILKKARALIVIDARDFSSSSMGQLQLFLDHLILETNFTKVVILCPPDITIQMDRHFTEQLVLPPLDFKSTVLLFGLQCPLVRGKCLYGVRTPKDLAALLVPAEKEAELPNSKCLSRRRSRIFDRVGRGIPGEILLAAKQTTEKDYLELLRIGRKTDYEPSFNTRSELEVEIARISSLMILAEEELDFLVAQDFREKLEELRFLRNSLYTLAELKAIMSKLLRERSAAVESQDYITAAALHKQLEDLQDKMQAEKEASLRVTIPCPRDTVKNVATETRKQPATVMDAGGHKQVEATPDKEISEIPIAGAEKAFVAPDIEDGDELIINRSTEVGTKSHSTPLSGHMPAMLKDSLSSSPPSEDSTSFTSNGLDGFVGVEFTGANKDYDADWNTQIIRSKTQLEANLSKLLRYGSVTYGDCSLKVVSIEHNGIARAVARLDCEIELHGDLRPRDYERVKDICRKIAFLLKSAGASETDLNQLMIGAVWIGSLELLIEAPSSVLNLLFSEIRKNGMKLDIEKKNVYLVGLAPAMLVRGPYILRASFARSEWHPDVLLLKEGDYRLLCPTSVVARNNLIAKGTGHGFWKQGISPTLQPLPTVRLLQACSYDFLPLSGEQPIGKADESIELIEYPNKVPGGATATSNSHEQIVDPNKVPGGAMFAAAAGMAASESHEQIVDPKEVPGGAAVAAVAGMAAVLAVEIMALESARKQFGPQLGGVPPELIVDSDALPTVPLSEQVTIGTVSDHAPDDITMGMMVASSTYGEDCVKVTKKPIVDPYGERGVYTGMMLLSTGMPHGYGEMDYDSDHRTYKGEWRHGRWHTTGGLGTAVFANGDKYVGQYKFDQRHGKGEYSWSDGRQYKGDFHEDMREGKGVFTWPDGAIYRGGFHKGKRHGYGRYEFHDGGYYDGNWVDGRYEGYGECLWSDGRKYAGEWHRGLAHGKGVETSADGSIRHDGQWYNDEPVGKEE